MPLEDKRESFLLEKETSERKKVSGREQEIRNEAKLILDKFAKALEKIEMGESYVEREEDRRKESNGKESDSDFRNRFFENAPAVKKDCIQAERGKWK